MSCILVTTLGSITVDLFVDECPVTCQNFLKLCKIKYYNNCKWKIQKGKAIVTGDPSFTGNGGECIFKILNKNASRFIEGEFHKDLKHDKPGIVSMVSSGRNKNASQFMITLRDIDYFDDNYTIFGEVAEGIEVATQIGGVPESGGVPYEDVQLLHTYILDDPTPNPEGLDDIVPLRSPSPVREEEHHSEQLLREEVEERLRSDPSSEALRKKTSEEKETRSRAEVLTMLGDIPHADIKPDENVLFVCQLNPVTKSEDLSLIFSQFGQCRAEVIVDRETGDSLQYAFIEFERKESCVDAYFKMDNVLIDDRRIKVDFSQSVANKDGSRKKSGLLHHIARSNKSQMPQYGSRGPDLVFDDEKIIRHHVRKVRTEHKHRKDNRISHYRMKK